MTSSTTSKISQETSFSNHPPNLNHRTMINPRFNQKLNYPNSNNPFTSCTARFNNKTTTRFRRWTITPLQVSVGRTSTATVAHIESQAISTMQTVLSQDRFHPHRWPRVQSVKVREGEDATVMFQLKALEAKAMKDAVAADHVTTIR